MAELVDLATQMTAENTGTARLYFVTRRLKDGVRKTAKTRDKYQYKTWVVGTDADVQKELHEVLTTKMVEISNPDKFMVTEYSIVSDDEDRKLMTYRSKEKISSFAQVVDRDLPNAATLPVVQDLGDLSEDLWAYLIETKVGSSYVLGLRKLGPAKVLQAKSGLFALFKTKEKLLSIFREETISFDRSLDAVYFDQSFFIISKNNFEEIVGLNEEYREEALRSIELLKSSPNLVISYDLASIIDSKPKFIRRLAKVQDAIRSLDAERIKRMALVAEKYNLSLNLDDAGNPVVSNDSDIDLVLKLLDDYFLESLQTNKRYGAPVKTELKRT